jgi:hypothetical protein
MRYRLFGPTGLRVSELFLGAMTFGEQGGVDAPPEECARILDTYAKAGGNVVDTAVNYRGGQSEEILGHCCRGGGTGSCCPPSTPSPATGMIPTRPATTQEPAAVPGDQPAAAADGLHRHLLVPDWCRLSRDIWVTGIADTPSRRSS